MERLERAEQMYILGESEPMYPHCFFSQLTIHHVLTDCCGLHLLYRYYFKTSSSHLINLEGEKPHSALIHFLKETGFYPNIEVLFTFLTLFAFITYVIFNFVSKFFEIQHFPPPLSPLKMENSKIAENNFLIFKSNHPMCNFVIVR